MKIENTTEGSAEALAHLLGLTARQVQRLAKDGVISRTAHGRYDLPAAVQAWGAYVAHGKASAELGAERRRLTAAQAYRVEIENKRLDGLLLDADDVGAALNEAMTIVATGMDSLGGRVAAELAVMTDTAAIRQLLLKETRRIRTSAADKLQHLAESHGARSEPATKARRGKRAK